MSYTKYELDLLYSKMMKETNNMVKQRMYNTWLNEVQNYYQTQKNIQSSLCVNSNSGGLYGNNFNTSRCWGSIESCGFTSNSISVPVRYD